MTSEQDENRNTGVPHHHDSAPESNEDSSPTQTDGLRTHRQTKPEANETRATSVAEGSSAVSKFLNMITETAEELLRQQLSDDIKRGLRDKARMGHFVSGTAPYGHRKVTAYD